MWMTINCHRTTIKIHSLIQHIEERVELDLRVWRYLLPPKDELDGHEIQGSLPAPLPSRLGLGQNKRPKNVFVGS